MEKNRAFLDLISTPRSSFSSSLMLISGAVPSPWKVFWIRFLPILTPLESFVCWFPWRTWRNSRLCGAVLPALVWTLRKSVLCGNNREGGEMFVIFCYSKIPRRVISTMGKICKLVFLLFDCYGEADHASTVHLWFVQSLWMHIYWYILTSKFSYKRKTNESIFT